MEMLRGLRMIINAVRVVALVHVAAIAAVHRHRTHRVADRMVAATAMLTHRTSVRCRQHHPVFSIQHQVSRYTDSKIELFFSFFSILSFICVLYEPNTMHVKRFFCCVLHSSNPNFFFQLFYSTRKISFSLSFFHFLTLNFFSMNWY